MGYSKKAKKGEISITSHRGRIMLRWRYNGIRYPLSLPYDFCPENMHHATIKVAEIKLDIMKGCFDPTLAKYKPEPTLKPLPNTIPIVEKQQIISIHELVPKFNDWGKNIRNVDVDKSIDYLYLRKILEKWVDVPIDSIAAKLNGEDWAITTYNRRLICLNSFFCWLVDTGILEKNPVKNVCRKREKRKKKNPRRKPLEEAEIIVFLEAIKNDTYCPTASRFKHSHYYPFLAFIFYTGVRNAEAIGLKVKHIDLTLGQIKISETLAITVTGSNHAARIRKGTKMENVRYLPLTDDLLVLLKPQLEGKNADQLVFHPQRVYPSMIEC